MPNGKVMFGDERFKDWSDGMNFEGDQHAYFPPERFSYSFGNSAVNWARETDELFFALHGSHYNYYAVGCKSDEFYSLKVIVLLWDPFTYPATAGALGDAGYAAAQYLERVHHYGEDMFQYAVWIDKFSNIGKK